MLGVGVGVVTHFDFVVCHFNHYYNWLHAYGDVIYRYRKTIIDKLSMGLGIIHLDGVTYGAATSCLSSMHNN